MTSNVLTRWLLPLALIVCAVLLSGFVFFAKLPEHARLLTPRMLLAFLGTPTVAILILIALTVATRGPARHRSSDMVVVWVVTFLFGVHAAILGTMIGMVGSLRAVVPSAVAVLLLGLAPTIGTLVPGSPLGIRTIGTMADDELWRRTHRLAGGLLAVSGVSGLIGARFGGPWALVSGVGPAVIALIVALGYGSQSPSTSSDEHSEADPRLSEESSVDRTDP